MVIERVPPVDVQTLDKITNAIVDFAQGSYVQPLSDAKRDALVARVMDSLGCAIAACREPEVLRVARAIGFTSGGGACTALLNGVGSVEGAAFLNGMMVRYHDWNDTYVGKNGGHPSDLIPMALAVGEWCGKSGDEVLRALGAGHHLMLDMCDGSNALSRGWDHATYVGIAAVIVAGLLMDLDRPQLANALSMMAAAGNMLLARSGKVSTWRSLASPQALRTGIFVASLAKAGLSGPDPVFEGNLGFLHVVSGDMELQLDVSRNRAGDTHLKRFPAVFHAQAPVEIALDLRQDLLAALGPNAIGSIDTINVSTHAFAIKWAGTLPILWEPQNRETADHSIPFMVAMALCRGEIHHEEIEAAIGDQAIRALTRLTRVEENPAFSARWPKEACARVTVTAGGRIFERELVAGMGHAARPLPPEQRAAKLIDNATHVIGAERAQAWAARLAGFAAMPAIGAALQP